MRGIVTVTFSPCIDKNITVQTLVPSEKLECLPPVLTPGGGGINVARAIRKLGGNADAVYPFGGYTGYFLNDLVKKEGVNAIPIESISDTRENIMLYEQSSERQYRLGMPHARLSEAEWQSCINAISKYAVCDGFIVVSGSLPPGLPDNIFIKLSELAKEKNCRLVADTKGPALARAVKAGIYLIKPNAGELFELAGLKRTSDADIVSVAQHILQNNNCEMIAVSMGAKGAMLITRTNVYNVSAPCVKVKSTVGAGDSMVAGIVYGLSDGMSPEQSLQFGVACGTAATLHPGTTLCNRCDADELFMQIRQGQKTEAVLYHSVTP